MRENVQRIINEEKTGPALKPILELIKNIIISLLDRDMDFIEFTKDIMNNVEDAIAHQKDRIKKSFLETEQKDAWNNLLSFLEEQDQNVKLFQEIVRIIFENNENTSSLDEGRQTTRWVENAVQKNSNIDKANERLHAYIYEDLSV